MHEFPVSYSHTEWYFLISLFGAREYKHEYKHDTIISFVPEVAVKKYLIKLNFNHSLKPDLPVTHSSSLCMWLSVLSFFSLLQPRCYDRVAGFVGGGNIAIVTAPPLLNFVLHCASIFISLWFLFIFFFMPGTSVSGCGD